MSDEPLKEHEAFALSCRVNNKTLGAVLFVLGCIVGGAPVACAVRAPSNVELAARR